MNYYNNASWDAIKKSGSQVLIVNVEGPTNMDTLDEIERDELMRVDSFIRHDSNDYGLTGNVTLYKIKERSIDDRNNLILFVEKERIDYAR